MSKKRLIVIGGGAAGFFCAVNSARLNPLLEVILLEKSGKLLSKVKVSGGGRCNITHACFDVAAMSRNYPRGAHFVRKSFHRFFTKETIDWFEQRGVGIKTEKDGRMFPRSDSSASVIDCLIKEAETHKVTIMNHAEVRNLSFSANRFSVTWFNHCPPQAGLVDIDADYVCVATGGYPKSSMFDWLRALGHKVEEPVPSLFTFNLPRHPITELTGISLENVRIKIKGSKLEQEGPLLITHWGFSGPAVLKLSAWGARELHRMNWEFEIIINWLPGSNEMNLKTRFSKSRQERGSQEIFNRNPFGLPQRIWQFLLNSSGIARHCRWAELPAKEQSILIKNLCQGEFSVRGKTTFREEFVTAGGVMLNEVDPNTMMSRLVSGLFFAGEVLNVDGITGGFNFQHAWTSGFIAASSITSAG